MKAFSLLVALMALSSLGGNGNGSMNLREKAVIRIAPMDGITSRVVNKTAFRQSQS